MDVYEKSLEILKKIIKKQKDFQIILIGGWAVYSLNPYLKSRDIDLLVQKKDFWKLKDFLEKTGFRQTVGTPLEKKGFAMLFDDEKIEIDVYDESIGGFSVNEIFMKKMFEVGKINKEKVLVAERNFLLTLKFLSAIERLGTSKGIKDHSDILALFDMFYPKIDFEYLKSHTDVEKLKRILQLIFTDYKKVKDIYPIQFLKYQRIKNGVLRKLLHYS